MAIATNCKLTGFATNLNVYYFEPWPEYLKT